MAPLHVATNNGTVAGARTKTGCVWKGIPYARPPVGDLRFRHAEPAPAWEGILPAIKFGAASPQANITRNADENSLFLNIWSPAADGGERPVLFFVHGGSLQIGAGSDAEFDGARLSAAGDIVVVTINYRLGALGFSDFSFLSPEFQPNCGLSDIVEALKWVYHNIAPFGGDPHGITAMGQSAGAQAVLALTIMESARLYISKAIVMSGGPHLLRGRDACMELSRQFLVYAGIGDARELHEMPAQELVKRQRRFSSYCGLGDDTFTIEVDGELLREYPIPAAMNGQAKGVPLLIGTTREEMSYLCIWPLSQIIKLRHVMDSMMQWESARARERIRKSYGRYGAHAKTMLLTDYSFRLPSVWFARNYSRHANTWMYSFDYATAFLRMTFLRACHSTDIPYVFGNFGARHYKFMFLFSPYMRTVRKVSAEMQRDFLAFIRTGGLPWETCAADASPAKHYNKTSSISPMVEPSIETEYTGSEFMQFCMGGDDGEAGITKRP